MKLTKKPYACTIFQLNEASWFVKKNNKLDFNVIMHKVKNNIYYFALMTKERNDCNDEWLRRNDG